MQETVTEETAKSFNVEKKLLDWCKERLKGYESSKQLSILFSIQSLSAHELSSSAPFDSVDTKIMLQLQTLQQVGEVDWLSML